MNYNVKYLADEKPEIEVLINKVTTGVYLIYCDFLERLSCDGIGSNREGSNSIFFGNDKEILIELIFYPDEDGFTFCDMSKKTFHATFFTDSAYRSAMSGG
jgi:hypothetical protein